MNPTFLNKTVYYVLALVFIYGIIQGFNIFLTNIWSQGESVPTFEQQPEMYKFLVFPTGDNVQIYSDNTLTKSIGTLDRAVQTNGQEIKEGIVVINLYPDKDGLGYVKYSSLSFLPPNNDQKWLQNGQKFVASEYGDLEIEWESSSDSQGSRNVQYTYKDHKHVRSTTYTYITDGKNLARVNPPILKSGVASAAFLIYDTPVFLILLIIVFVLKRRIFRKM